MALAAPTLVSPANGDSTNDQTPTFTWNRVTGATSYRLQVDNDNSGTSNCFPTVSSGTGYNAPTAIDVTVADPGSRYYSIIYNYNRTCRRELLMACKVNSRFYKWML